MNIVYTECCAVKEIANLSDHRSAEEAMRAFCDQMQYDEDQDPDYYEDRWGNWIERSRTSLPKPAGFYTFTGVVRHSHGGAPPQDGKYAPNFATYIRRHKLGSVVESQAAANRQNHPDHFVKVYIWHPYERRLKAWWKEHGTRS